MMISRIVFATSQSCCSHVFLVKAWKLPSFFHGRFSRLSSEFFPLSNTIHLLFCSIPLKPAACRYVVSSELEPTSHGRVTRAKRTQDSQAIFECIDSCSSIVSKLEVATISRVTRKQRRSLASESCGCSIYVPVCHQDCVVGVLEISNMRVPTNDHPMAPQPEYGLLDTLEKVYSPLPGAFKILLKESFDIHYSLSWL